MSAANSNLHSWRPLICVLTLAMLLFSASACAQLREDTTDATPKVSGEIEQWVLGKWIAQSRNMISIHGDMEILKDKIVWVQHGEIRYRVVSEAPSYILVELERKVGCGNVLRLGPDRDVVQGGVALRMRTYSSLAHAGLGDPGPGACSSGWYLREVEK